MKSDKTKKAKSLKSDYSQINEFMMDESSSVNNMSSANLLGKKYKDEPFLSIPGRDPLTKMPPVRSKTNYLTNTEGL